MQISSREKKEKNSLSWQNIMIQAARPAHMEEHNVASISTVED